MLVVPTPPFDDFSALADAQEEDTDTLQLVRAADGDHSLKLRHVPLECGRRLWCDYSTGRCRPVLPTALRRPCFNLMHDLAHPGVAASQKMVAERFVWRGLNKDVQSWVRTCVQCQRAKTHRHTRAAPTAFRLPSIRFGDLHVDLVGPLPTSEGCTHMLTIIDRYTRWIEAIPLARTVFTFCSSIYSTANSLLCYLTDFSFSVRNHFVTTRDGRANLFWLRTAGFGLRTFKQPTRLSKFRSEHLSVNLRI